MLFSQYALYAPQPLAKGGGQENKDKKLELLKNRGNHEEDSTMPTTTLDT